jgi:transposase
MAEAAKKIEPQGEWLSESEIAKRVGLHRQTVVSRLEDLGYEPDQERSTAKLKVHFFTEDMLLEIKSAKDSFAAARLQDLRWAAKLKRQKYEKESGVLVEQADVVDTTQALFGAMHKELAVRMPKDLAVKLAKAKTSAQVNSILKIAVDRRFKTLRDDFEKYLK